MTFNMRSGGRHECTRVVDANQDSCAETSTLMEKLAIAFKSALSVLILCTGAHALQFHNFIHSDSYLVNCSKLTS